MRDISDRWYAINWSVYCPPKLCVSCKSNLFSGGAIKKAALLLVDWLTFSVPGKLGAD